MSQQDKDTVTNSEQIDERKAGDANEEVGKQGPSGSEPSAATSNPDDIILAEDGDDETLSFASEATESSRLNDLEQELAEVKKRLAEADIRAAAEVQNMRKRAERDVENARKFALEKFAGDLLAVADNLERGLDVLPKDDENLTAVREGMQLTLKSLLDTFERYKLEQINPLGEPFNPEHHEAMTMVPNPDLEPNSVMDVLEKGYQLNGRLIRPARVIVSKAVQ